MDYEPEELLCVGGPCAGRRFAVPRGQNVIHVQLPTPIDLSILDPSVSGGPLDPMVWNPFVVYRREVFAERMPQSSNPIYTAVLAYSERTVPMLRELLNGYERSFERGR